MTLSISCMPGSADRALVADDDDVARDDPPIADRGVAVGLRLEDAGRTAMEPPLVAGELDDAAIRCERAAQDRQAAGRLDRPVDRTTTTPARPWAPPRPRPRRPSARRRSASRRRSARRRSARGGRAPDPRPRTGASRCSGRRAGGRPRSGSGRRSSRIRRSRAGFRTRGRSPGGGARHSSSHQSRRPRRSHCRSRSASRSADGRTSRGRDRMTISPQRRAASSFAASSAGMSLRPAGDRPEDLHHHAHRVGGELAAARAGARARGALHCVQVVER